MIWQRYRHSIDMPWPVAVGWVIADWLESLRRRFS